jgi:hypothetical protein
MTAVDGRGLVIRRALAPRCSCSSPPGGGAAHVTLAGTVPARDARVQRVPAQVECASTSPSNRSTR